MNYAAAEFFRLSLSCHGRKPNTTLSPEHFEGIPRSGAGNAVAADVRQCARNSLSRLEKFFTGGSRNSLSEGNSLSGGFLTEIPHQRLITKGGAAGTSAQYHLQKVQKLLYKYKWK